MEKVHSYNIEKNKCPNCKFFNTEQNIKKHLNSTKNKKGELCKKYQIEYSTWYYLKMR